MKLHSALGLIGGLLLGGSMIEIRKSRASHCGEAPLEQELGKS